MDCERTSLGRSAAHALAGPLLMGAILGLRFGAGAAVRLAIGLPAIIAAVALLVTPALYVGGAAVGLRLSSGEAARAAARAVHALGVGFLGVAPLGLFVAATSADRELGLLLAVLLVLVALGVGLRRLHAELGPRLAARPAAGHALFAGYALAATIIGGRLFVELVGAALEGVS